jgi:hypothetical protein
VKSPPHPATSTLVSDFVIAASRAKPVEAPAPSKSARRQAGPEDPSTTNTATTIAVAVPASSHRALLGTRAPAVGEDTMRNTPRPTAVAPAARRSRARSGVKYHSHKIITRITSSLTMMGWTTSSDPRWSATAWLA